MGHSRSLFLYLRLFKTDLRQKIEKNCPWLDLNRGYLMLESTALPTVPQPLPSLWCLPWHRSTPSHSIILEFINWEKTLQPGSVIFAKLKQISKLVPTYCIQPPKWMFRYEHRVPQSLLKAFGSILQFNRRVKNYRIRKKASSPPISTFRLCTAALYRPSGALVRWGQSQEGGSMGN